MVEVPAAWDALVNNLGPVAQMEEREPAVSTPQEQRSYTASPVSEGEPLLQLGIGIEEALSLIHI